MKRDKFENYRKKFQKLFSMIDYCNENSETTLLDKELIRKDMVVAFVGNDSVQIHLRHGLIIDIEIRNKQCLVNIDSWNYTPSQ